MFSKDYFSNTRVNVTDFHRVFDFLDVEGEDIDGRSANGNALVFPHSEGCLYYAKFIEFFLSANNDARFNVLITSKYGMYSQVSTVGRLNSSAYGLVPVFIHCRDWVHMVANTKYGYSVTADFPDGIERSSGEDVVNSRAYMLPSYKRNIFRDVVFEDFLLLSKHLTIGDFAVGSLGKVVVSGFIASNY